MLRVQQLVEGILLRGVGQQREQHVLHGKTGRDFARVVLRGGQRMHVAAQSYALLVIDEGSDAVSCLGGRVWRLRREERGKKIVSVRNENDNNSDDERRGRGAGSGRDILVRPPG